MSRIFLSHSSVDWREAVALKQWLALQEPPLVNEIFLDIDPGTGIPAGVQWKDALRRAHARCEAVICLLSSNWEASNECRTEYRVAETLNKQIFCARLEPSTGDELISEWQRCDLFADGPTTTIEIGRNERVSFSTEGLLRLRNAIRGTGISAYSFVWPPHDEPDRAPYRGWEPFEPHDAAVFFGRDAQIVRAMDAVRGFRLSGLSSLFVILGPSGTGKSSFLRAGLLPRLAREDRRFALLSIVRPERHAITGSTGLAASIFATRNKFGLNEPTLGAIKVAFARGDVHEISTWLSEIRAAAAARLIDTKEGATPAPPTLILPLDQAEELFAAEAGAEADQFLSIVRELVSVPELSDAALVLAATIRTDRYEAMQAHPSLASVETVPFDKLKPMPRSQFKEVITGPAERATEAGMDLRVTPGLVDQLLDDASEGADTLPMLSLTMARLYADYGSAGELTVEQYEAMGGMRQVVQTEIDSVLSHDREKRSQQLEALREAFVPWLATINPQNDQPLRRVARWADLPEASRPLIDKLVARRLLVKDVREGDIVVEVALESLLRQWHELDGWLRETRHELKAADDIERAAYEWQGSDQNPDWLLTGTRLLDAEALAEDASFARRLAASRDFLTASRQAQNAREAETERHRRELHRRTRNLRIAIVVTAISTIIAVLGVIAVVAFVEADRARLQAVQRFQEAIGLRLSAESQGMLASTLPGGDVRAFQQLLAARVLSGPNDRAIYNAVVKRLSTQKILETPDEVKEVALSPDGQLLVTTGNDGAVRFWDTAAGQPKQTFETGGGAVTSMAFSPDGRLVITGGTDGTVRVWNVESGVVVSELRANAGAITGLAVSPDGRRIATSGSQGDTELWDAATAQPVLQFRSNSSTNGVKFSADGRRLAAGNADGTLEIRDVVDGRLLRTTRAHNAAVNSVAFSPDSSTVATGSTDTTVRLWDAESLQPKGPALTGHQGAVWSVAFNFNGSELASGSTDMTIRLWRTANFKPLGQPLVGHQSTVWSVAFGAQGTLASASRDRTARLWNLAEATPLTGPTKPITSLAFSLDGIILAGDADGMVNFWNPRAGVPLDAYRTSDSALTSVAAAPLKNGLLATGSVDGVAQLWNGPRSPRDPPLVGHEGAVTSVAFNNDGTVLATGGVDKTVRLWNTKDGRPISRPLTGHTAAVTSVAFGPDGRRLVSGSDDNTVRIWDATTGGPIGEPLLGHEDFVLTVAYSSKGVIASGSRDQTIRLWNPDSGEPIRPPLVGHENAVNSVAFNSDGSRLASASVDSTVRLWHPDTGQPVTDPLTGPSGAVNGVVFSPDGQSIAAGGTDTTVWQWPTTATSDDLCDKLTANMSRSQWDEWVSRDINYQSLCPGLRVGPG